MSDCEECGGSGKVSCLDCFREEIEDCETCDGTEEIDCDECNGTGEEE